MITMAESVQSILSQNKDREGLAKRIETPRTRWDRFQALRELYQKIDTADWEPYPVDWMQVFTKIEQMVWSDLRCAGVNMWPQYPVGRRFVDFGNPAARIAIECDGKGWHDPAKDYQRDMELGEMGWTVFRVSGSDCMRTLGTDYDLDEEATEKDKAVAARKAKRWLEETSEGLISAIAAYYYGSHMPLSVITMSDIVRTLEKRASEATPFCATEFL